MIEQEPTNNTTMTPEKEPTIQTQLDIEKARHLAWVALVDSTPNILRGEE